MQLDGHGVALLVDGANLKELRGWIPAGGVRPAHGKNGPVFNELDIALVRLLCEFKRT